MKTEDRNPLLNSNLWPEGIIIRKFYSPHISLNKGEIGTENNLTDFNVNALSNIAGE